MKQYKESIDESLDLVSEKLEVSYLVKKLQEINKLESVMLIRNCWMSFLQGTLRRKTCLKTFMTMNQI